MKKFKRPWGYYENLSEGEGYKVKRIVVRPGQRLSSQKHKHRNESWTVIEGRGIGHVNRSNGRRKKNF